MLNGVLLFGAEALRRRAPQTDSDDDTRIAKQVSFPGSFGVGAAQALALIPGFSRSGAAMSGGLLVGLSHKDAARFSFLLATPIIGAAAALKLPELLGPEGRRHPWSGSRRGARRRARCVSLGALPHALLRDADTDPVRDLVAPLRPGLQHLLRHDVTSGRPCLPPRPKGDFRSLLAQDLSERQPADAGEGKTARPRPFRQSLRRRVVRGTSTGSRVSQAADRRRAGAWRRASRAGASRAQQPATIPATRTSAASDQRNAEICAERSAERGHRRELVAALCERRVRRTGPSPRRRARRRRRSRSGDAGQVDGRDGADGLLRSVRGCFALQFRRALVAAATRPATVDGVAVRACEDDVRARRRGSLVSR